MNFDWAGTQKELKEWIEAFKKGMKDTEGIDWVGLYSPSNAKWHYTMFWKTDNYHKWQEANQVARDKYGRARRDYKKLTHGALEVYAEYEYQL